MKRILLALALFFGIGEVAHADGLLAPCSGLFCQGPASITSNAPILGNGTGIPIAGTRSGSTTTFATSTGTLTNGHCVSIDGNGNFIDAGGACTTGGGGGTVNAGTAGQLTYYASSGTAVSGNANATISSGALTLGQASSALGTLALSGSTSGTTTLTPAVAASGTLTLPSATDTLVGRATTDTLTNKSISGSTNTLSNIANSSLTNSATTVNGQTCTLGSTCTISAAASGITVGTTTITSGTSNGLLYDNAGNLGNLVTANSGVLVTSGAGVPSISTTLPNGLALGTPGSVTLTNATGLPISGITGLGTGVGTALAAAVSGSGGICLTTNCVLVTPTLGVATATSINKVAITAPATGSTLTIADGKTLTDTSGVGANLLLGATGGGFTAYGGVTCTNQFLRVLSSAGAGTCASVAIASDVSGLGTGVATWLATPSSANLRAALTDETGTGLAYFQGGDIGTPSAGVGTNLTALNASNFASGTIPAAQLPGQGSCSVALAFGGNSTGITYSSNLCHHVKQNNQDIVAISMILTSKGTATGSATITGLPNSTLASGGFQSCSLAATSLTLAGFAQAYIAANTTTVNLTNIVTGSNIPLTDAAFTNATNLFINCSLITN